MEGEMLTKTSAHDPTLHGTSAVGIEADEVGAGAHLGQGDRALAGAQVSAEELAAVEGIDLQGAGGLRLPLELSLAAGGVRREGEGQAMGRLSDGQRVAFTVIDRAAVADGYAQAVSDQVKGAHGLVRDVVAEGIVRPVIDQQAVIAVAPFRRERTEAILTEIDAIDIRIEEGGCPARIHHPGQALVGAFVEWRPDVAGDGIARASRREAHGLPVKQGVVRWGQGPVVAAIGGAAHAIFLAHDDGTARRARETNGAVERHREGQGTRRVVKELGGVARDHVFGVDAGATKTALRHDIQQVAMRAHLLAVTDRTQDGILRPGLAAIAGVIRPAKVRQDITPQAVKKRHRDQMFLDPGRHVLETGGPAGHLQESPRVADRPSMIRRIQLHVVEIDSRGAAHLHPLGSKRACKSTAKEQECGACEGLEHKSYLN